MTRIATGRIAALLLSAALVLPAVPAAADEIDPTVPVPSPEAMLSLTTPGVLTLPSGDGVRDLTTVTVASDIPTTVTLTIVDAADSVVRSLPTVDLTADSLSAYVDVPVIGLPAGELMLEATPAAGTPASALLQVGSGQAASASLSLSTRTIYTWKKSEARSTVASVTVADETGLKVPFTGSVTAKVGSRTQKVAVVSSTGAVAKATISSAKLAKGTARVSAAVIAGGEKATSNTVTLAIKNAAITSTKLSASVTTFYPTKDGYKDSAKLSVVSSSTTGGTLPVTGTVKITSKGKTVKTWKLTSSKKWSASWDGKVKGKVVPGTYSATVSVSGPEGAAKKSTVKLTVKKGKLVSKKSKVTVDANSVLTSYVDGGYWDYNMCWEDYYTEGDVFCDGDDASDDTLSVLALGTVKVPSAVVSSQKYGKAKVRLTAKVTSFYGTAAWGYTPVGKDGGRTKLLTGEGKSTAGWLALPATVRKLDVVLGLGEYSFVGIDTFTIEYSYRVLSSK